MAQRIVIPPNGVVYRNPRGEIVLMYSDTVPSDGAVGFAPKALHIDTDTEANNRWTCNIGSASSCNFNTVEVS